MVLVLVLDLVLVLVLVLVLDLVLVLVLVQLLFGALWRVHQHPARCRFSAAQTLLWIYGRLSAARGAEPRRSVTGTPRRETRERDADAAAADSQETPDRAIRRQAGVCV
ncbi:hypothetical protein EYF80_064874 [Liparis tanakae]|uniref:Uncharacterized protein n=1 Tax=Liparis tanakae TaxID=230148 RepID=A0A4Z2E866_9TELE|nr:hypothetical protein EYF80_064874 [Liparis tanakae]